MSAQNRCPTCGALLPGPDQPCPFCAEAQRLLEHLATEEPVRLCARCGTILQDDEDELCRKCQRQPAAPPWRRDDRIATWIRDRFVEPVAEREGIVCPSCGKPIPPLIAFCPHCGHKLVAEEVAETPVPESTAPEMPVPEEAPLADVSVPVPVETEVPAQVVPPVSETPAAPSAYQRFRAFVREQFAPAGQGNAQRVPVWQQFWGFLRSLVRPSHPAGGSRILLWVVVGIILVGLLAVIAFWAFLLSSGVSVR